MGGNLLFPDQASTLAPQVDLLYLALIGLSGLIAIGVFAFITYFAVKYRRGSKADRSNPTAGKVSLEIAWTVIPIILSLGMFTWAAGVYLNEYTRPANHLDVYVLAKQWMWKFQHVEGQGEIDELHVPVGRPILLHMISQDVIHSFYVPAFRIKLDVLPGRYTEVWFEATKPGTYRLSCAEYCGMDHAGMGGDVIAMTPADYQQWLSGGLVTGSPATGGAALFQQLGCINCHRPDGGGPGPSLVGLFGNKVQLSDGQTVTADENYLRESILDPTAKIVAGYQPIMPSFKGQVSEEEILQLISYIQSLGK